MASGTQTTYAQTFQPAWYTNYAQQTLANQSALSQQPYQAYGGQRIQGFTPDQQQGFQMTRDAATAGTGAVNNAVDVTKTALGRSGFGVAQPYMGQAGSALGQAGAYTGASTNPLGMNAAQPYFNQAGQTSASQVGQYMDPYLDNVVNRYGELGARTLSEQLMPAVTNKYISAGQLGGGARPGSGGAPSGMMTDTARALRDVQEGVGQQQMQALSQGYGQALGAAQTDLARQAQLGQSMGQMGQNQQQILANAGQQYGNLGAQFGNLGQTQAGIYNQDTQNQFGGAAQMAQLGQQQQQMGLTGANAVLGIGGQQQALGQANLDVAYQDFLRQQGYPQEQIDKMVGTIGGLQGAVPTGQIQSGTTKTPNQSTAAQLLGVGATLAGSGVFGGK